MPSILALAEGGRDNVTISGELIILILYHQQGRVLQLYKSVGIYTHGERFKGRLGYNFIW